MLNETFSVILKHCELFWLLKKIEEIGAAPKKWQKEDCQNNFLRHFSFTKFSSTASIFYVSFEAGDEANKTIRTAAALWNFMYNS